jgi:hypothetical protein
MTILNITYLYAQVAEQTGAERILPLEKQCLNFGKIH